MVGLRRALMLLVHILLLEVLVLFTRTVGVTRWKLEGNTIVPASTGSETESANDKEVLWSRVSGEDPEFAVLMKRTTSSYSSAPAGSPSLCVAAGGSAHAAASGTAGGTVEGQACPRSRSSCRVNQPRKTCPSSSVSSSETQPSKEQCELKRKVATPRNPDGSGPMSVKAMQEAQPILLTCGDPVDSTDYDFLEGIARRNEHPAYPEPEVAMIFKRTESDTAVDLFEVEMMLRKAFQENPESLTVLNQIGNFWRIKGNTQLAIECFRTALSFSQDHPDILLNLARVLFNLRYLDNAVYLAKRSLHMKAGDSNAWLQYFTVGEVYKAMEKYEDAAFFFRTSLELNPGLQVAERHLRDLGLNEHHSVNVYTILIILALILVVLVAMYYVITAVSVPSNGSNTDTQ